MDLKRIQRPPRIDFPTDVLDAAESLPAAMEDLVARVPGFECMTVLDRKGNETRTTPRAIWDSALQVQGLLQARGFERGQTVVVAMKTSLDLVAAVLGISFAGGAPAIVAPPGNRVADPSLYRSKLAHVLRNAEAVALYCDDEVARVVGDPAESLASDCIRLGPADVGSQAAARSPVVVGAADLGAIQYSSGSTGLPKGVQLSHGAIMNHLRALQQRFGVRSADVYVNWAPLYHDMGLMDTFLLPLFRGCHTVLIPTLEFMKQPSLWLWALHHYRGVISFAPNFAYALCAGRIQSAELEGLDLSCWRTAVVSAEPVLAETMDSFLERFAPYGFRPEAFLPAYGMAENVTAVTTARPDEQLVIDQIDRRRLATDNVAEPQQGGMRLVSSGRVLAGTSMEIRSEDGRVLADREVGEIWFRGDCLFDGYRKEPERTASTVVDGWFRSADLAYTVDGELFFVSRVQDMIVIAGEKYPPQDIEDVINTVEGVRKGCAVAFGVLAARRGTEDVAAVVETRLENAEALTELEKRIRSQVMAVTGLGMKHLLLVPSGGIEKTTAGKLARTATRERYADRFVD